MFATSVIAAGLITIALPLPANGTRGTVVAQQERSATPSSGVMRVEITRREPLAEGMEFGHVGAYEKLVGTVQLEADPTDPHNSLIVDLDKAPRNAQGVVEYTTDLYILKPVDMSRGNGKIFFDVNNRGNKSAINQLDDPPSGVNQNEPSTVNDVGNGFLLREGYSIVTAGWEGDLTTGGNRMTIQLPTVTEHGAEITGTVAVQYDVSRHIPTTGTVSMPLSGLADFDPYETASLDSATATLTVRDLIDSPEAVIPPDRWAFASCQRDAQTGSIDNVTPSPKHICLFDGFSPDKLYQLVYTAKNPKPMGLGYAAVRDLLSFLRYLKTDSAGTPNPLGANIKNVYCWGNSSSGMYLRDFIYLGFNEDLASRKVCDGVMVAIPGAMRLHLNTRFTQPDIYSRQDLWAGLWPMATFPFSYAVITDPITGRSDGIMKRPATDPLLMHIDGGTEFWQLHASLVTHDGLGQPVPLPDNVRYYAATGTQHAPTPTPSLGICQQLSNPTTRGVFYRALLVALDEWATKGVPPPDSRYPRADEGTLTSLDKASLGFPSIPGVIGPHLVNTLPLRDYGPHFGSTGGVITSLPGVPIPAANYAVLVPRTDSDGNDIAGLRRPDGLETPLATYTGWNMRRAGFREGDTCGLSGMYLPFAQTEAERISRGDPRPSLEARYASQSDYLGRVGAAAVDLYAQRYLLEEDVVRIIQQAAERELFPAGQP